MEKMNKQFIVNKKLFNPNEMIKIRLLSSVPVHNFSSKKPSSIDKIIIHFHGGGYIANTSFSH